MSLSKGKTSAKTAGSGKAKLNSKQASLFSFFSRATAPNATSVSNGAASPGPSAPAATVPSSKFVPPLPATSDSPSNKASTISKPNAPPRTGAASGGSSKSAAARKGGASRSGSSSGGAASGKAKRKDVQSEDEMEWGDMDSGDESVFEDDAAGGDDSDCDDDGFASDSDDDGKQASGCFGKGKKRAKGAVAAPVRKRLKKGGSSAGGDSAAAAAVIKTPVSKGATAFPTFASSSSGKAMAGGKTPSSSGGGGGQLCSTPAALSGASKARGTPNTGGMTPSPRGGSPSLAAALADAAGGGPTAGEGGDGGGSLAGTFKHNSFAFLKEERQDKRRRAPDHPDYDPRTLFVPSAFLQKETPAMQQWWGFKSDNMDTVLFFKVGKFYELFHMDADVGVRELELTYMKGDKAHSGFPEIGYGKFAAALIAKGYRVARVEQTETPDMLKDRNARGGGGGKKDKVVAREVCSVLSRGTRTFCFLDDVTAMATAGFDDGRASAGVLMSLVEMPLPLEPAPARAGGGGNDYFGGDEDEDATPLAACEYGVCMVDTTTATFTLGQFADDAQRSRLRTLLAQVVPAEILFARGGATSDTTRHLIGCVAPAAMPAVELRPGDDMWTAERTVQELERGRYFELAADKSGGGNGGGGGGSSGRGGSSGGGGREQWPHILRLLLAGGKDGALALSALGGATSHLKRGLIDHDMLSMRRFAPYVPPDAGAATAAAAAAAAAATADAAGDAMEVDDAAAAANTAAAAAVTAVLSALYMEAEMGDDAWPSAANTLSTRGSGGGGGGGGGVGGVGVGGDAQFMVLDGVALANLEVLRNSHDGGEKGSLWAYMNRCGSVFGCRLLKEWICKPLLRVAAIEARLDCVEELSGPLTPEAEAARKVLKSVPDLERLLTRVHSMASLHRSRDHPDGRAIMYEGEKHGKRKTEDFVTTLRGLEAADRIPNIFAEVDVEASLLRQCVRRADSTSGGGSSNGGGNGGLFPDMTAALARFREAFDEKQAKETGRIKPRPGVDADYDGAVEEVGAVTQRLQAHLAEQQRVLGSPAVKFYHTAKDRFQIEVSEDTLRRKGGQPAGYDLVSKKKGYQRFYTPMVRRELAALTTAEARVEALQADQARRLFDRFDQQRALWAAAVRCLAHLDALLALAQVSAGPGHCRPQFCAAPNVPPFLHLVGARHPCLSQTYQGGDFIPNDIVLGTPPPNPLPANGGAAAAAAATTTGSAAADDGAGAAARMLLLSGPNMGGKSTLLRQTCLAAIMAQVGCFVPADEARLTPCDRVFTRVGASDRILAGQSTFFVELSEAATIVHHATPRSLVILDELGRGTSTFDGTAIAHAVVHHLVKRTRCLAMFATHYHSLVADWGNHPEVQLGHMACLAEGDGEAQRVIFLYKLAAGACPKSFGINVARLARLPPQVLASAAAQSAAFEAALTSTPPPADRTLALAQELIKLLDAAELDLEGTTVAIARLQQLWEEAQTL